MFGSFNQDKLSRISETVSNFTSKKTVRRWLFRNGCITGCSVAYVRTFEAVNQIPACWNRTKLHHRIGSNPSCSLFLWTSERNVQHWFMTISIYTHLKTWRLGASRLLFLLQFFALFAGRRAGGGHLVLRRLQWTASTRPTNSYLLARSYCAAAIVDEDRPGHTGGGACLRRGDGRGFWAWAAASSSEVSMSNMTWTSLYPQVCTSSWSFRMPPLPALRWDLVSVAKQWGKQKSRISYQDCEEELFMCHACSLKLISGKEINKTIKNQGWCRFL
jgi:hypothetical protein